MELKKHQKVLSEMVEKILFDEVDLNALKHLINKVCNGNADPKQLKALILNNRAKILKRVIDIFPFYIKWIENTHEIDTFSNNGGNTKLQKELEEKNTFLQLLAEKIEKITLRLQKS